jgi:hypothetical protein
LQRRYPQRDRAVLEVLYGCGLGHEDVTTTQIYLQASPKHLQAVFKRCHPRSGATKPPRRNYSTERRRLMRRLFRVPAILCPNFRRAVTEYSLALTRFRQFLSASSSSGLSLSYRRSPLSKSQLFVPFHRTFALLRESFKLWQTSAVLLSRRPNYLSAAGACGHNHNGGLHAPRTCVNSKQSTSGAIHAPVPQNSHTRRVMERYLKKGERN